MAARMTWKGAVPQTIMYRMMPTDHMSIFSPEYTVPVT